ncbi:MAG: hypothetical protein Q9188_005706 [Gyalolechia gomerana]
MTSKQASCEDAVKEKVKEGPTMPADILKQVEEGLKAWLFKTPSEAEIRTYPNIAIQMLKETELSEAKGVMAMLKGPQLSIEDSKEVQPEWYTWIIIHPQRLRVYLLTLVVRPYALWYAVAPQRYARAPYVTHIIGIHNSKGMVSTYNEIVKRQASLPALCKPTSATSCHNQIPIHHNGPWLLADTSKVHVEDFDLAIVSLRVYSFEILNLAPEERQRQLSQSLKAIINRLSDESTLLIVDF